MKHTAIILLLALLGAYCEAPTTDPSTAGVFDGNTYTNELLGLSITFPDTWWLAPEELIASASQSGGEVIEGESPDAAERLRTSEMNTFFLFKASQYKLEDPNPDNVIIFAYVERIDHLPDMTDGYDYLVAAKSLYRSELYRGIGFVVDDDIAELELAGRPFHQLRTNRYYETGDIVNNILYAHRIDNFAFVITALYTNEQDAQAVERVLDSLSFID